jgi:hypothetical protein
VQTQDLSFSISYHVHCSPAGSVFNCLPYCSFTFSLAEIRKIMVGSQPWGNSSPDPIWKKKIIKKGLVDWLKW